MRGSHHNAGQCQDSRGMISESVTKATKLLWSGCLIGMVCLIGIGLQTTASAGEPAAQLLTAAPSDGGRAYFSIVLPGGWKMVPGKGLPDKFSFQSPDDARTYHYTKINFVTPDVIEEQLAAARKLPERTFLDRGESGETYFDPWLYATWKKVYDNRGGVTVTATFWDNRIQTFFLHDTISHFDGFAESMQTVVNNIRLHGERPRSIPEATAAFQEVDPSILESDPFAKPGIPKWAVFFVLLVASGVVGMMWFERKRRQARLEQITQEIEERKLQRAAEANALNSYLRR